eukprot:Nitzschia sp. Nitz4//scaffold4_size323378//311245//311586//NITZ4_000717-RA/size323378-exonerate_protein2genome-gene-0.236-mRNA-1//1//CDS//3329553570//8892//frame0
MTKTGIVYERQAILDWLVTEEHDTCPMTRKPLSPSMMIPDVRLKMRIAHWQDERHRKNPSNCERSLYPGLEAQKTKETCPKFNLAPVTKKKNSCFSLLRRPRATLLSRTVASS